MSRFVWLENDDGTDGRYECNLCFKKSEDCYCDEFRTSKDTKNIDKELNDLEEKIKNGK